jgi:hypothetical protein
MIDTNYSIERLLRQVLECVRPCGAFLRQRCKTLNSKHLMTALIQHLLTWLWPQKSVRRYYVTPRHKPNAFRRSLLREAMLELKCDPVFAALPERRHS